MFGEEKREAYHTMFCVTSRQIAQVELSHVYIFFWFLNYFLLFLNYFNGLQYIFYIRDYVVILNVLHFKLLSSM